MSHDSLSAVREKLEVIDTQCHVAPDWYEPIEVLLAQMDRNGVGKAVLIQLLGRTNNDYQEMCARKWPHRFVSVVAVSPSSEDATLLIRQHAERGTRALRLRATTRSEGPDPLAIWRAAQSCALSVSCVGPSAAFAAPEFRELVESLPDLTIVLEHLGGSSRPDAQTEADRVERAKVFDLARFKNVYLKVPGLGELSPRKVTEPTGASPPFEEAIPRVLVDAVARFGAHRLMWGSDFPVVSSREGYGNSLAWCQQALASLSNGERADIFANTARRVFRLDN
jgi:L-fuconolactonase